VTLWLLENNVFSLTAAVSLEESGTKNLSKKCIRINLFQTASASKQSMARAATATWQGNMP
jgi:hypothetical protein